MSNEAIATVITNQSEQALTIADSSEPKSIDELAEYNVQVIGALKGPDSVNYGIKTVQNQKIYITTRSVKTIKEYRQYQWKKDRNGKSFNPPVPEDGFDHSMDGIRYAITSIIKPEKKGTVVTRTKNYVSPNRTAPALDQEEMIERASNERRATTVIRRR
jgi:phage terminase large subunit